MPRTRVKICGINSGDSCDAAVHHGADALGFVFTSSPRQIVPGQANILTTDVPVFVAKVAVFLRPSAEEVSRMFLVTAMTMYQSDGCVPPLDQRGDQPHLGKWLPVYRTGADGKSPILRPAEIYGVVVEGPHSGVGVPCDWSVAATLARRHRIILAGGLTPDNVADAIRAVRPYGVDVSSGVESSPGKKDPIKIRDFLQAVRDVDRELSS